MLNTNSPTNAQILLFLAIHVLLLLLTHAPNAVPYSRSPDSKRLETNQPLPLTLFFHQFERVLPVLGAFVAAFVGAAAPAVFWS
jgi:hypothetical protein